MSNSQSPGFLTKKEVEEQFGRSHRSLTRDYSKAVRTGDTEFLKHLRLRTEDGEERAGTEVTLEFVQELSNQGLTPTWYIERSWAEEKYAKRAEPKKQKTTTPTAAAKEGIEFSTVVETELLNLLREQLHKKDALLEQRIEEHQADKQAWREQSKMFKEIIDTIKDEHADTKSLLRDVHGLMGKMLPEPQTNSASHNARPDTQQPSTKPSQDADLNAIDVEAVESKPPTRRHVSSGQSASRAKPRAKATRKQKTTPKKSAATTKKKSPPKPPQKKIFDWLNRPIRIGRKQQAASRSKNAK